jgi:hypothetical protein
MCEAERVGQAVSAATGHCDGWVNLSVVRASPTVPLRFETERAAMHASIGRGFLC